MRFNKKHNSNDENFWLSATDMMAGILVVVLLLLMLFLLYLNNSQDDVFTPLDATEFSHPGDTYADHEEFATSYEGDAHDSSEGDRGDTQSDGQEGQTLPPTEPPTEPQPQMTGDDGYDKAAVFVTVVDADSGNTIKKSGTAFELYAYKNGIGGLQTLHSYYQEKIEYKRFETGDNGTFYLPEKITQGYYSLHNLTAPAGYYIEDKTDFEIDDFWDWPEPYMVTVRMKPIKKTIRVTAEDAETSAPMEKVTFKVFASEDITAADGSVRVKAGEEVDKITTDETGYAESKELYIGKYYLKQQTVPEFYAVDDKAVAASVSGTAEGDTGLVKVECRKTSVTVRLIDERTEAPLVGAVYSMEGRDDLVTDENGEFTVTDLEKSAEYELKSVSVPDGYIKKNKSVRFKVDSNGLVDGKTATELNDTAYTISLNIVVKDRIFGRASKGVDLQLMDENGEVLEEWTTNDQPYIITGLSEGKYYAQRAGDDSSRFTVYAADKAELQTAEMLVWDAIDLFALLMAAGAVVILGLVFIFALNRRKKVNRKHA